MVTAGKKTYRSSNLILQTILEGIYRVEQATLLTRPGILKSNLIEFANLKAETAQKYLDKLESAGYIFSEEAPWGERMTTYYKLTEKGRERYRWFVTINTELEEL